MNIDDVASADKRGELVKAEAALAEWVESYNAIVDQYESTMKRLADQAFDAFNRCHGLGLRLGESPGRVAWNVDPLSALFPGHDGYDPVTIARMTRPKLVVVVGVGGE